MELPNVSEARVKEAFKACNEYLRAILSGDKDAMDKAFQEWQKISPEEIEQKTAKEAKK